MNSLNFDRPVVILLSFSIFTTRNLLDDSRITLMGDNYCRMQIFFKKLEKITDPLIFLIFLAYLSKYF